MHRTADLFAESTTWPEALARLPAQENYSLSHNRVAQFVSRHKTTMVVHSLHTICGAFLPHRCRLGRTPNLGRERHSTLPKEGAASRRISPICFINSRLLASSKSKLAI